VEKEPVLRFLQLDGKLQPLDIERSFVKIEQSLDHECIIVGETFDQAAAFAITPKERLVRFIPEMRANKLRCARRALQIARLAQNLGGACKRRDHQTVPGRT